jgi:ribosome-binding protein aMBF1 (putative translation factor)
MARKMNAPISQQLREAINASGMSRYRICKEIELGESTMSHFMAGDCGLQLSTIDRLGKLLGLKIVSEHRSTKIKGR